MDTKRKTKNQLMFRERVTKIQDHLQQGEALLIETLPNRRYFTGFPSSAGILLISKDHADLLMDFRYYEKAKRCVQSCNVILMQFFKNQLKELTDQYQVNRLYVETGALSVDAFKRYATRLPGVTVSDEDIFDRLIGELRSIKTADEIQKIIEAQKITDDTFSYILGRITPGRTERDIMLDMEFYLRRQGSEGVSFDFIVVSGKNSSLPHGVPTDRAIQKGDFITMDFGAVIDGYHSDMTRTVAVGAISDRQCLVYDTVLEAQKTALNLISAGKRCKDIDHAARSLIDGRGFEGCFGHGLGHSVGLEIHEQPCLNMSDETILQPGVIMTVEPGIYLDNEFGVRIEDMVAVTDSGCQNLTNSPKDLIIL